MSEFVFYTAQNSDRWDLIAYKFYKNSYKIQPIIEANPHVSVSTTIKAGTVLRIPVLLSETSDKSLLPVWKRGNSDN